MADEFDRRYLPELVQTTFSVSLGAGYMGYEMAKSPQAAVTKMFGEMFEIFRTAADAGDGLQTKAEAAAGACLSKGRNLMENCKSKGEKFTEAI